jgi:hypothetical protein
MSKASKQIRNRAATELRESRHQHSAETKANDRNRAAGLKQLADNEEWLEGEKPRIKGPKPK